MTSKSRRRRPRRRQLVESLEQRNLLTTAVIGPIDDGSVFDSNSDGTYDSADTTSTTALINEGGNRRAVLEFDISFLNGATVNSATLEFTPTTVSLTAGLNTYGAAGDGVVTPTDAAVADTGTFLDRVEDSDLPPDDGDPDPYGVDVTGLVNGLSAAEADFAVFALAGEGPSTWAIATSEATFVIFEKPQLTIDYNLPPTIEDATFAVVENSASGTAVGTVTASDEPGDTLTYAITSGNTNNAFGIDSLGNITVDNAAAIDFEASQIFALEVQVTDEAGQTATAEVTVQVTNDPSDDVGEVDPVQASIDLADEVWSLVRSGDLSFRQARQLAALSYSAAFWSFFGFEQQAERRLELFVDRVNLLVSQDNLDASIAASLISSAEEIINSL